MKSHEELMFKLEITPKKYVISLDNPKPIQAYVKNTSGIEQDVFVTVESFFFRIVNPTAVKHYTTQIYRHMKPNETLIFEIGTWDDATLNLPIEDLAKKYMHLGSIEGCLQVHHSEQWGFPLLVAEVCDDIFPDTYDTINRGWCIIQLVAEHETEFMKKRKADFEEVFSF